MNRENILKVADAIEQHSIPDLGFNMSNWFNETADGFIDQSGHNCGTVACIAGWSARIATGANPTRPYWSYEAGHTETVARQFLGLDYETASDLFEPAAIDPDNWGLVPPSHAVSVLRHLAETGEVDWERALNGETV